jgi:hypothetical protein
MHDLGDAVDGAIAGFSPRSVPFEAAVFARSVVQTAAPVTVSRARCLLFATSKLAAFAISVGLDPVPEVVLDAAVIDRFVLVGTAGLSRATRRTLKTNLRFVASRALRMSPEPVGISRDRAKTAYSAGEIAAYLALADAQPTLSRKMRATGLICLGAGAGLMGHDLRAVRGIDVTARSGGLVVSVGGTRPRVVPVLSRYHAPLVASAGFAGESYVVGGDNPSRHNVTTPVISSLAGGMHLGRLDTGRLRSTWLTDCAMRIGLGAFMAAAGVDCSQRLGDIVAGLADLSEKDSVFLLGGKD